MTSPTAAPTPVKLRPAFKTHGGKHYLSPWVIANFPADHTRMTYLEPFCGGASVLLNKPKAAEEAINDLDPGVTKLWRALRDDGKDFAARLKRLKYTEATFQKACKYVPDADQFEGAVWEYVRRRMSRGGLRKAFGWSDRERGGKPGDVNAWETMLKMLPLISARVAGVAVFNKPALEVIDAYNDKNTLIYADPPYVHESRVSADAYEFEMTNDQHLKLLAKLTSFRGRVILSGYPSQLYTDALAGWRCLTKEMANHSSQSKVKAKKTEVLWMNY